MFYCVPLIYDSFGSTWFLFAYSYFDATRTHWNSTLSLRTRLASYCIDIFPLHSSMWHCYQGWLLFLWDSHFFSGFLPFTRVLKNSRDSCYYSRVLFFLGFPPFSRNSRHFSGFSLLCFILFQLHPHLLQFWHWIVLQSNKVLLGIDQLQRISIPHLELYQYRRHLLQLCLSPSFKCHDRSRSPEIWVFAQMQLWYSLWDYTTK